MRLLLEVEVNLPEELQGTAEEVVAHWANSVLAEALEDLYEDTLPQPPRSRVHTCRYRHR